MQTTFIQPKMYSFDKHVLIKYSAQNIIQGYGTITINKLFLSLGDIILYLENLKIPPKKKYLTLYTRNNSKQSKDLNVIHESTVLLGEIIGDKLINIGLRDNFMDLNPKANQQKYKQIGVN